ncbi:hypothetical protein X798_00293 [Onchocerca flexuosa]|uniref:Uncharacterized protein n=2 Tax=Onchocerca flexuosa TaxID=387005 RepID=A0A183HC03_9BILA|nr:hypothetical protein X798_00293 [Onchocerca flexuosa]VDO41782.1 unnamed protein product [Onchocerca flexuosa]
MRVSFVQDACVHAPPASQPPKVSFLYPLLQPERIYLMRTIAVHAQVANRCCKNRLLRRYRALTINVDRITLI